MPQSDQTRLLIIEDVPQVAQYIRGLLNAQSRVKLLEVVSEGAKAVTTIKELRPDVVVVDALLQGRVKGPKVVDQIREAGLGVSQKPRGAGDATDGDLVIRSNGDPEKDRLNRIEVFEESHGDSVLAVGFHGPRIVGGGL
jgi:CheY-like chemotaxis protein